MPCLTGAPAPRGRPASGSTVEGGLRVPPPPHGGRATRPAVLTPCLPNRRSARDREHLSEPQPHQPFPQYRPPAAVQPFRFSHHHSFKRHAVPGPELAQQVEV